MKLDTTKTSRRAMLGALAIAMPAATFAAVGHAVERQDEHSAGVSAELASAIAAAKKASDDSCDYLVSVFDAAEERFNSLCKRIPHVEVEGYPPATNAAVLSTEDTHRVKAARSSLTVTLTARVLAYEPARLHREAMQRLVDAADARDARVEAARKVSGFAAAEARMAELHEVESACDAALEAIPCKSWSDVLAKLDHGDDYGFADDAWLARDVRRLASSKEA